MLIGHTLAILVGAPSTGAHPENSQHHPGPPKQRKKVWHGKRRKSLAPEGEKAISRASSPLWTQLPLLTLVPPSEESFTSTKGSLGVPGVPENRDGNHSSSLFEIFFIYL